MDNLNMGSVPKEQEFEEKFLEWSFGRFGVDIREKWKQFEFDLKTEEGKKKYRQCVEKRVIRAKVEDEQEFVFDLLQVGGVMWHLGWLVEEVMGGKEGFDCGVKMFDNMVATAAFDGYYLAHDNLVAVLASILGEKSGECDFDQVYDIMEEVARRFNEYNDRLTSTREGQDRE